MNHQQPFSVVSAEVSWCSDNENTIRSEILEKQLKQTGASYIPLAGNWRGRGEVSFLVFDLEGEEGRRIAEEYSQESVLYVDSGRACQVFDCITGESYYAGQWIEVPPDTDGDKTTALNGKTYKVFDPAEIQKWRL